MDRREMIEEIVRELVSAENPSYPSESLARMSLESRTNEQLEKTYKEYCIDA